MSEVKTNKISSLASNNDITLDPDGTGDTIVASGNLGVGEASPAASLHISTGASTTTEIRLTSNNTGSGSGDRGRIAVHSSRNDGTAYEAGRIDIDRSSGTEDKAHILFSTNDGSGVAERIRIDSSGRLLLRKTSGVTTNSCVEMERDMQSGVAMEINDTNSSGTNNAIHFRRGGSVVGKITIGASSTGYVTSSDYRLKENVADMTGAIARVKQLAPKRFNFIVDADTTVDGFLAHEAQTVVPEAITGTKDEVDADGDAVMQGIDQSKLIPLLTGALQEAIGKIETLETEMTALKARVTALEDA